MRVPHFSTLPHQLKTAINQANYRDTLCPQKELLFRAFHRSALEDTKVVILNSEPSNLRGKSNGLAFAQRKHTETATAILKNIFKEVRASVGSCTEDVTLESWASQGVLLINLRLSVLEGRPNSHKNLEWEQVIIEFLKELDELCRYKVYMLWGKEPQGIESELDAENNLILKASHPAPFSAKRSTDEITSFVGCDHFAEANEYLARRGKGEIKW